MIFIALNVDTRTQQMHQYMRSSHFTQDVLFSLSRLRTGWSVKTSQFSTYPKPQPLTESEQQIIVSVIKKAEEMDLSEQKRVGLVNTFT